MNKKALLTLSFALALTTEASALDKSSAVQQLQQLGATFGTNYDFTVSDQKALQNILNWARQNGVAINMSQSGNAAYTISKPAVVNSLLQTDTSKLTTKKQTF